MSSLKEKGSEREPTTEFKGRILEVKGIGNNIAYQPFPLGKGIVVCRVEDPLSDWKIKKPFNPHSVFFTRTADTLIRIVKAPIFGEPGKAAEDPFGTWIENKTGEKQLLFGAVFPDFDAPGGHETVTKLFLGADIEKLDPTQSIAEIRGMRDVRFAQAENGNIHLLTRPNTKNNGWIGYTTLENLDEIKYKERFNPAIERANKNLLNFRIGHDTEIGEHTRLGANSAYIEEITLPDRQKKKLLRIFCHTSDVVPEVRKGREVWDFESGVIKYIAYDGYMDPDHPKRIIHLREIARASDFPRQPYDSKGARYENVVFVSGTDGGEIYFGVRDRCSGVKPDPGFDPAYFPVQ